MKSRPILFSAPMVRALLAGTKTQTRRVCKPANESNLTFVTRCGGFWGDEDGDVLFTCPYGQPGLRLWVRETWAYETHALASKHYEQEGPWVYAADNRGTQGRLCDRWRPSIHMFRAASRLTLEITGVRVERLQDISEADAIAEGWPKQIDPGAHTGGNGGPFDWYRALWESINGPGSWDANPWVWCISFKVV